MNTTSKALYLMILFIILLSGCGLFERDTIPEPPKDILYADLEVGTKVIVPGWQWVDVKNLSPVTSSATSRKYGDQCGIKAGGTLTVLGNIENKVLVEYNAERQIFGTECSPRTITLIGKGEFLNMKGKYAEIQLSIENEKRAIRAVLKEKTS